MQLVNCYAMHRNANNELNDIRDDLSAHKSHELVAVIETVVMKKALRETQTLHPGCSKAEP